MDMLVLVLCLLSVHFGQAATTKDPVETLQEYIQINTTTYNDLTPAVEFWQRLAAEENLPIYVYYMTEGYPIVVIKWAGSDSSAKSIMLNSHMDVVPADEEDGWTYPPFDAVLADDGNIYGRGTQDMKSVSIQHFEAMRSLKAEGVLLRDVYMTLMPDEEVGGVNGMIPFLESPEFAEMNVGLEMDEGSPFPLPLVALFYQDKIVWQIVVECHGTAEHGSTFSETNTTATGKCNNVINKFFEFRNEEYEISLNATIENAGGFTSVNLNRMTAGTADNIVPSIVSLLFDIRLSTSVNVVTFEAQIRQWLAEAGSGIELSFINKDNQSPATLVSEDNPYYIAIVNAANTLNLPILPVVPPGSTDARHVRSAGIPAFGFSPMPNTPLLLHAVNEYIGKETFLQGIAIFKQVIYNLASIPAAETLADSSVFLKYTSG